MYLNSIKQQEELKPYTNCSLYFIGKSPSSAGVTGNLTKLINFDKIYMSSEENIIDNKMIFDTLQKQNSCVVFITTDTYWLSGYDAQEILSKISKQCDVKYEKIINGSFGEFYYLEKN